MGQNPTRLHDCTYFMPELKWVEERSIVLFQWMCIGRTKLNTVVLIYIEYTNRPLDVNWHTQYRMVVSLSLDTANLSKTSNVVYGTIHSGDYTSGFKQAKLTSPNLQKLSALSSTVHSWMLIFSNYLGQQWQQTKPDICKMDKFQMIP